MFMNDFSLQFSLIVMPFLGLCCPHRVHWKYFFLFYVLKESVWNYYFFLKCLVEFSVLLLRLRIYFLEMFLTIISFINPYIFSYIFLFVWTAFLVAQIVKSLPAVWETGFDPWVRKIPWRRKWQPIPVFLPGKSHGWRRLAGYSPWGCKESHTIEWLHFLSFFW